jgi:hypothetical protein
MRRWCVRPALALATRCSMNCECFAVGLEVFVIGGGCRPWVAPHHPQVISSYHHGLYLLVGARLQQNTEL